MRLMYDSVVADHLPAGGDLYAAYVDGKYRNVDAVRARFPGKPVVTITVLGGDADVADVETGDLTPTSVVAWVRRQRAKGKDPTVYTLQSWWGKVRDAFNAADEPEPHYWIAHYDNVRNVPAGAVAKQYGGDRPGNYDVSAVLDFWPGIDPEPHGDDLMRTILPVTIPAPDADGRQLVPMFPLTFDTTSSAQVKANDNGVPAKVLIELCQYAGVLILSFYGASGGPAGTGNVAVIIEHR